jgi:hypothetical protein
MKKKLLVIACIVVGVLVVAVVLLIANLDRIARVGVTRGGSAVLGVPVDLKEADVSLSGSVGMEQFTIGSPEGYKADHMFKLDRGHVEAEVMSFLSDEIVVRDVLIDGPEVTLELKGGKANWAVLLDRLKSKSEKEEPPEEEAAKKRMRIDHLVIRKGKIRLVGLPTGAVSVPLPKVEMHDIGKKEKAKRLPGAVLEVVRGLYAAILTGAGDVLPAEQMKKLTGDVSDVLKDASKLIEGAGGETGKKAKKAVGDPLEVGHRP